MVYFYVDPDIPNVTVTTTTSPLAGDMFALTCNVSLNQNLRQSPVIEWVWPSGIILGIVL